MLAISFVPSVVLHAQQGGSVQGALSIAGGSATDVLGTTSRALTVAPSVTWVPGAHGSFTLQAGATRFDNSVWSLTGGASGMLRATLGEHVAAVLGGAADATSTSYEFSYRTASVMPALELSAGPLTAYAGAVGAFASTTTTSTSPAQHVPGLLGGRTIPGQTTDTTASRSITAGVVGASLALLQTPHVSFVVGGRSEPRLQSMLGSGTLTIAIAPAAALEVSAGAYSRNELIGIPAGRFVNVGISLRSARSLAHAPEAEGVSPPPRGVTRLAIPAPDASRVDVAGDFDNWKPLTAQRAANGVWYVDLRIPAGQYRYAFRVNGGAWTVPSGVPTVDDDFGGKSAWLVVSGSGSAVR